MIKVWNIYKIFITLIAEAHIQILFKIQKKTTIHKLASEHISKGNTNSKEGPHILEAELWN
jgi:hypothetical protein